MHETSSQKLADNQNALIKMHDAKQLHHVKKASGRLVLLPNLQHTADITTIQSVTIFELQFKLPKVPFLLVK